MARIDAWGAHEIARCWSGRGDLRRLWIITSDGRILTRYTNPATNYTLAERGRRPPSRDGLLAYVRAVGYEPEADDGV